jgi:prepilin-type N-terminal cleavage/methylation domain-containing protein
MQVVMKQIKKKSLTLIEIMIVIALIGIIGSVVGVNMKKSMDKAKEFKTKAQIQKIEDALNMYYAENSVAPEEILLSTETILKESGLFKDDKNLLKDAHGKSLIVLFDKGGFVCQKAE